MKVVFEFSLVQLQLYAVTWNSQRHSVMCIEGKISQFLVLATVIFEISIILQFTLYMPEARK